MKHFWNEIDGIDNIRLGQKLEEFHTEKLEKQVRYPEESFDTYQLKDGITLFFEHNILTGIQCRNTFFYKNVNLIKMNVREVLDKILLYDYQIVQEKSDFKELYFKEKSLTIYIQNETIIIALISNRV